MYANLRGRFRHALEGTASFSFDRLPPPDCLPAGRWQAPSDGRPPRTYGSTARQEPRLMNSAGKLTVSKLEPEPLFFCCMRLMDSTAARAIS